MSPAYYGKFSTGILELRYSYAHHAKLSFSPAGNRTQHLSDHSNIYTAFCFTSYCRIHRTVKPASRNAAVWMLVRMFELTRPLLYSRGPFLYSIPEDLFSSHLVPQPQSEQVIAHFQYLWCHSLAVLTHKSDLCHLQCSRLVSKSISKVLQLSSSLHAHV